MVWMPESIEAMDDRCQAQVEMEWRALEAGEKLLI
jgi:hypothetical protein